MAARQKRTWGQLKWHWGREKCYKLLSLSPQHMISCCLSFSPKPLALISWAPHTYLFLSSCYHLCLSHQSFSVALGEAMMGKVFSSLLHWEIADMTEITRNSSFGFFPSRCHNYSSCTLYLTKAHDLPLLGVQRDASYWGGSEEMKYWCGRWC